MQQKLLVLLKEFHSFAIANGIKYSLDWGSLLGAIRHQGFIPWDDDLDIMVDRENYQKILKTVGGKLEIDHCSREWLWIDRIRLKDSGVDWRLQPTLDIFILDNAPDGNLSWKVQYYGILFLMGMMKGWPKRGNFVQRSALIIAHIVGKCFSWERRMKWFHQFSQRWNHVHTKRKITYNTLIAELDKFVDADVFDEVMLVPFEDTEVYVTKAYHRCLTCLYGDYMTPLYTTPMHIGYESL